MKVPTLTGPRTSAPNTTSSYSSLSADPAAFGAGLFQATAALGAKLQEREDKTQRFTALTNFSDFETQMAHQLEEEKRAAPANGSGFAQSVEGSYDKFAADFLQKQVPPQLREEFAARIAQSKQGIIGNALDFQYKAGDAFFRQGISKVYEQGRNALDPRLGGDPSQLEAWKAKAYEQIDASDLNPVEKEELRQKVTQGLEGVGYRAAVAKEATTYGGQGAAGAASIIMKEEGFRETPYWDVNAYRIGYGSDTITLPDGSYHKVQQGERITKADADRDLARRMKEFQTTAAEQVGVDNWNALPGNVQSALTSVAYNYGNLPSTVVKAVQSGDTEAIAKSVSGLSANKERRAREAAIIRGEATPGSAVDMNPAFSSVPYEDRIALRDDAFRDAAAQANAQAKATKAAYQSDVNNMLTSIHDGVAGQSDIDSFRQSHPAMDYDDITKMDTALKNYTAGLGLAASGFDKMQRGLTFDPTNTDDKKRANAMVGKDGLAKLDAGDNQYVENSLVPMVTSIGMVPPDVSGMLTGMIRSDNRTKALFALDTLSQLQDADPRAFNTSVSTDTANDVAIYRMNRRSSMSQDDLMKQINPGMTAEERNARAALTKEAKDILGSSDHGVKTLNTLVSGFVKSFNSYNPFATATSVGNIPWAAQQLAADYQTAFTQNYARVGDMDKASALAVEQLKKTWQVTQVGVPTLMKNPPEQIYKPYNDSYDYIKDEIKQHYKLFNGEDFQLISDDNTANEVEAWKQRKIDTANEVEAWNQEKIDHPPSYRIAAYKDGVWRELPGRMWFKPSDEVVQRDKQLFDMRQRAAVVSRRLVELGQNIQAAKMGDVMIDPDEQAEFDALRQEYVTLRQTLGKTNPDRVARKKAATAAELGDIAGGLVGAGN